MASRLAAVSARQKALADAQNGLVEVVPLQVMIETSLCEVARVALDVVRKHEERAVERYGRAAGPGLLAAVHTPSHWLGQQPPGTGHLFLLGRYCVKRWTVYEHRRGKAKAGDPPGPAEQTLRGMLRSVLVLLALLLDRSVKRYVGQGPTCSPHACVPVADACACVRVLCCQGSGCADAGERAPRPCRPCAGQWSGGGEGRWHGRG